ncbi:hypothetical protein E2C01_031465 [Portunus trituberculatus]|uniref:Uncharacterized protein n=1 Tax=Portunus trituberculatus TaxID=210409 RepID=A0A5B7EY67_PORTR|nr:hypothetical protein [Portunus trituberculatus]
MKYVKNWLFRFISVCFTPKLRNTDKTIYLLKRLIYVFLRCFMEKKKLSRLKILYIEVILHCYASKR